MTPKEVVEVAKATLSSIESNLLDSTGNFKKQPDLPDDSKVVEDVLASLTANGIVLSPQVTTIITAILAVLSLLK